MRGGGRQVRVDPTLHVRELTESWTAEVSLRLLGFPVNTSRITKRTPSASTSSPIAPVFAMVSPVLGELIIDQDER